MANISIADGKVKFNPKLKGTRSLELVNMLLDPKLEHEEKMYYVQLYPIRDEDLETSLFGQGSWELSSVLGDWITSGIRALAKKGFFESYEDGLQKAYHIFKNDIGDEPLFIAEYRDFEPSTMYSNFEVACRLAYSEVFSEDLEKLGLVNLPVVRLELIKEEEIELNYKNLKDGFTGKVWRNDLVGYIEALRYNRGTDALNGSVEEMYEEYKLRYPERDYIHTNDDL